MRPRSLVRQRVDEGRRARAAHRAGAEVGDVEEPDALPDGGVLGEHPSAGVLDGHRPAAEVGELGAGGDVPVVQGGGQRAHGGTLAAPCRPGRACERRGQRGPYYDRAVPPTITATDHPLEKLTADAVVVAVGKGPDGPAAHPGRRGRRPAARRPAVARAGRPRRPRRRGRGHPPALLRPGPVPGRRRRRPRRARRRRRLHAPRRSAGPPVPPAARWPAAGSVVSLLAAVGGAPDAERLHAVGEGSLLGAYEFTAYKSDLPADRPAAAAASSPSSSPAPATAETRAAPGPRRRRRRRPRARPGQHPAQRPLPRRARRPRRGRGREARADRRRSSTRTRWPPAATAASSPSASGSTRKPRLLRLTYSGRAPARRSRWSARASPSTAAASRSSPPRRWRT